MAGTVTPGSKRKGTLDGEYQSLLAYPFDFTADVADGSYPSVNLTNVTGYLAAVRVIFDAQAPDNIDVQVADGDGVDLLGGSGSGFTATGQIILGPPAAFIEQLIIKLTGNTVNSAGVRVVLYVF